MARKRYRLKFQIDKKVVIIGGIAAGLVIAAAGALGYVKYQQKKAAEAEAMDFSLRSYDLTQLQGNTYYVKDGDNFHPLAPGVLLSTNEHDTEIPVEASPETRLVMYLQDDQQIPTLYKDDQLIYKSAESGSGVETPTQFVFERFRDEGYTFGIRGLSNQPDGGKFKTEITDISIYPGSSISALQCTPGDVVTFDKIDGKDITEDNVSVSGTITGLKYNETYAVDVYSGTEYKGLEAAADTHVFSSFELYTLTDYGMDPDGYMTITIPEYFWSGYYYVNGIGMIRYINNYKSEGITDTEYNTPYFLGVSDENGEMILNPADNPTTKSDSDEEIFSDDQMTWNYNLSIDNQQKSLYVTVAYSDARTFVDGKIVKASDGAEIAGIAGIEDPTAKLTSPSGTEYELVATSQNNGAAVLSTEVTNPESGTWNLEISGMYARVFSVDSSFEGSTSNMVVKDGDADAEMSVYLPNELENGQFTFTWDETGHAATFEMEDINHNKYGNVINPESVIQETYGTVILGVGPVPAGEYKVKIKGESLGHVYFSYEDLGYPDEDPGDAAVEDTENTETSEDAEATDTENKEAKKNENNESANTETAEAENNTEETNGEK